MFVSYHDFSVTKTKYGIRHVVGFIPKSGRTKMMFDLKSITVLPCYLKFSRTLMRIFYPFNFREAILGARNAYRSTTLCGALTDVRSTIVLC